MKRPTSPGAGSLVRVVAHPVRLSGYVPRPRLVPLCGRTVRVEKVLHDGALFCSVPEEPGHAAAIRPEWVEEVLELVPHVEPPRAVMLRVPAPEPPPPAPLPPPPIEEPAMPEPEPLPFEPPEEEPEPLPPAARGKGRQPSARFGAPFVARARAIAAWLDEDAERTPIQAVAHFGVPQAVLSRSLALLELPPEEVEAVARGEVGIGEAAARGAVLRKARDAAAGPLAVEVAAMREELATLRAAHAALAAEVAALRERGAA